MGASNYSAAMLKIKKLPLDAAAPQHTNLRTRQVGLGCALACSVCCAGGG